MRYDPDTYTYYVHTPKGDGRVIHIRRDERSMTHYATVELDGDKGLYEFSENELLLKSMINTKLEVKMEHRNKEPLVKDEDVIKALECCMLSNTHQQEECDKCPFNEIPQTICQNLLAYHALQIIKRSTR